MLSVDRFFPIKLNACHTTQTADVTFALPLIYKLLTTSQPAYLNSLISVQSTLHIEHAPHLLSS